jgi:cytochrome b
MVGKSKMGYEISRVVSILLAITGLGMAYGALGEGAFHLAAALVVVPLGCIWYGEEIGSFTMNEENDSGNPVGVLITYSGWIALSALVAVIAWLAMQPIPV